MTKLHRILIPILVQVSTVSSSAELFTGQVVGISDGDTIKVLQNDKQKVKVRLYGIDCPEKSQAFGNRAKQFASKLVFRKTVTVEIIDRDRYGRSIGRVVLPDGKCLNEELVRAGLAWWYRRYVPKDSRLSELEKAAREANIGLWQDKNPIPPWEYRRDGRVGDRQKTPLQSESSGLFPFMGNARSHVFHAKGCRHYRCKNCNVGFKTKKEAEEKGFRPHRDCVR